MQQRCELRLGFVALALISCVAPAAAQDLDDVMGGFEDEDPTYQAAGEVEGDDDRFWDVSGSAEVSGTVNYLPHRSPTGTNYVGLQRLRSRLNLDLEIALGKIAPDKTPELLEDWQFKVSGWGFYDLAYAINGRSDYTEGVRSTYELDAEVGESYLQGSLHDRLDFKVGRQVVIWGRSESLRVLDVLNPLDNREPGRVDLEDLRRPVGMLKLDAYLGDWSVTAIAIPEMRIDRLPVVGSDFFNFPGLPPGVEVEGREHFEDTEVALAINGIFSGWDISLHGAWFWTDVARPEGLIIGPMGPVGVESLVYDRLWLAGAGGNYTTGSWLLKSEIAYVDGVTFFSPDPSESGIEKGRLDFMFGVEYYGLVDTTFVVEVLNRHLFDYERILKQVPSFTREDTQSLSFRLSQNFLNDTLHATALAILFQLDAKDGAIVRFDVAYDVRDAVSIGIGILLYEGGELPPVDGWNRNDRVFFNAKWSF